MDLLITYRIHPHPRWQRQGLNLITEYTVSVWDLILGKEIHFFDILGIELLLTIPPRTQSGVQLRVRGRGLRSRTGQSGDLLVKLQARIPDEINPELLEMIKKTREE
jgi:DnaJ-class molecular chaperone